MAFVNLIAGRPPRGARLSWRARRRRSAGQGGVGDVDARLVAELFEPGQDSSGVVEQAAAALTRPGGRRAAENTSVLGERG